MTLIVDFGRALGQMGDPRFSRVLLQAVLVTLAGLALVFWVAMLSLGWLLPETVTLPWIGTVGFVDNLVSWAAVGVMLALSVVLMVPVAAGVVGFFLDEVAAAVEARHYPNLPPLFALGLSQQVADSLRFMALVIAVNIGALLIYVIAPPLAPVASTSVLPPAYSEKAPTWAAASTCVAPSHAPASSLTATSPRLASYIPTSVISTCRAPPRASFAASR